MSHDTVKLLQDFSITPYTNAGGCSPKVYHTLVPNESQGMWSSVGLHLHHTPTSVSACAGLSWCHHLPLPAHAV